MEPQKSLHYPIGTFRYNGLFTTKQIAQQIEILGQFPEDLNRVVGQLSPQQIDLPYREGGWTGRQLIHHLADSHMHAYLRTKFALLEQDTVIKAYNEKLWAAAKELESLEISASLEILSGVHRRWCGVFESMDREDFLKTYLHPEYNTKVPLHEVLHHYAWHAQHHLAHLQLLSAY